LSVRRPIWGKPQEEILSYVQNGAKKKAAKSDWLNTGNKTIHLTKAPPPPLRQGIFFTSLPTMSSSIDSRTGDVVSVPVSLFNAAEPGWKPMWTAKSQAARRLRRWCRR
jgi:hypothetical protein